MGELLKFIYFSGTESGIVCNLRKGFIKIEIAFTVVLYYCDIFMWTWLFICVWYAIEKETLLRTNVFSRSIRS